MPRSNTTYRIFVASPGDVHRERDAMQGVVNTMNRILDALLPDDGVCVELVRWESHVAPQIARGPQAVVNDQLEPCDIFVGILSERFGTPTAVAGSGTEEEFRRAYAQWEKHQAPWIVFYFNTTPGAAEGPVDRAQQDKVAAFRAELQAKGLCGEYRGAEMFMSTVLPQLLQIVGLLIKEERHVRSVVPEDRSRAGWAMNAQAIPAGQKVTIVALGDKDACYHRRDKYIGRSAVVLESQRIGDWLRGTVAFETPLFDGDDGRYMFLQFAAEPVDGEQASALAR